MVLMLCMEVLVFLSSYFFFFREFVGISLGIVTKKNLEGNFTCFIELVTFLEGDETFIFKFVIKIEKIIEGFNF